MKIFKYVKNKNERILKLFGFTIMEQTVDSVSLTRKQKFLGGIITTYKTKNVYDEGYDKEIKIFNCSFMKREEQNNHRIYSLFNKTVKKISLAEIFKKEYSKYFDKKYDDIYIMRCNSGEIYLTLTYIIDSLIKKNGSKNPLLVASQKYHFDMIEMLCPDLPHIYIKGIRPYVTENEFKVDNQRFFLLYDSSHFQKFEFNIGNKPIGECHHFKSLLDLMDLKEKDLGYRKIKIHPDNERAMLNKVKETGLNIDKFVFLAPEALSCKLYSEDFWVELINKLQNKGYDVFINLTKSNINLTSAKDFKTCDLSFTEAFALAKHSKRIVSLRSGFTELLLQTDVPIDVLYTKLGFKQFAHNKDVDIYHVMSGFDINKIPFVDKTKIRQFNTFEISPMNLINEILESILKEK